MVHPILDRYYERDPCHVRSSAFVQASGLVSNEKAPSPQAGLDACGRRAPGSGSRSPDLVRRSSTPASASGREAPTASH